MPMLVKGRMANGFEIERRERGGGGGRGRGGPGREREILSLTSYMCMYLDHMGHEINNSPALQKAVYLNIL